MVLDDGGKKMICPSLKPLHSPTAAEFRQMRERSSLSQSGLAELLGLHDNSIKGYESGRVQCNHVTWHFMLARLAERDQEIVERIREHSRRWVSQSYRNEWMRKARENYCD